MNSDTAVKYTDRVKSGVTGEQIWLQINEPTPNDQGKYVMELFDGKTGYQKTVDLSGQGKWIFWRFELIMKLFEKNEGNNRLLCCLLKDDW